MGDIIIIQESNVLHVTTIYEWECFVDGNFDIDTTTGNGGADIIMSYSSHTITPSGIIRFNYKKDESQFMYTYTYTIQPFTMKWLVEQDFSAITVTSDYPWTCTSSGNVMLDRYESSGNATINLSVSNKKLTPEGVITFIYDDESCTRMYKWHVTPFFQKYLEVTPQFDTFTKKRTNEYLEFTVEASDGTWTCEYRGTNLNETPDTPIAHGPLFAPQIGGTEIGDGNTTPFFAPNVKPVKINQNKLYVICTDNLTTDVRIKLTPIVDQNKILITL